MALNLQTISAVMSGAAFMIGNLDGNKTGVDDLTAKCLRAGSAAVSAYKTSDYAKTRKYVDTIIAALEEFKNAEINVETEQ